MSDPEQYRYHDRLQCFVKELRYDYERRLGMAILRDGSCTDMRGCIDVFESIDPEVRQIQTCAGDKLDTVYFRDKDGGWDARLP